MSDSHFGRPQYVIYCSQLRATPSADCNISHIAVGLSNYLIHINNIVKGAFYTRSHNYGSCYHLRNIAKIRKYINVTTAEVLVPVFTNSKLDFCNTLLHGLPNYKINKLQSVQNAAARVIACLSKFDRISDILRSCNGYQWGKE